MTSERSAAATVALRGLGKVFEGRKVLQNIDLQIQAGEFVAIVGRSGCGKSTLLRLISGLEEPSSGTARVLDADGQDAHQRVRFVFQEPRLLPWKSVLNNVCLGLSGCSPERARSVLHSVGLADRVDDYPSVLSGGQRQRVALARALVHEPGVMLLDEPFGALDALTRIEAQRLVEQLWLSRGFTALLVTHDVSEAVLLADRVLLVEGGEIAESFDVNVPRPRRREHPEVARVTAAILDAIFRSPDSVRGQRVEQGRDSSVRGTSTPLFVVR